MSAKTKKRVYIDACENCEAMKRSNKHIQAKIVNCERELAELKKECIYWKKRANCSEAALLEQSSVDSHVFDVVSEYCEPHLLHTENCNDYYEDQLVQYPNLRKVLQPFFSEHFRIKEKAAATNSQWKQASGLYKAFILDTFLKSKNSKAVLRTNLLLGVALYQSKIPESAWKLLQRVRVLPSVDTVERYLKTIPPPVFSDEWFIIFSYDNCDIMKHRAKVRFEAKSTMLHLVSRLVFEIPVVSHLKVNELYKPYNIEEAKKFARWLVPDYTTVCKLSEKSTEVTLNSTTFGGMRFALKDSSLRIKNTKMTILEAEINRQTLSYDDIAYIVRKLWEELGIAYGREFALFNGDWQTFTRMWDWKIKNPGAGDWLVPFPGEWHWNWHILQGIYKIWGHDILRAFSLVLEYKNLDIKCQHFHYGEDFLEIVTLALSKLFRELKIQHPDMTPMEILDHYKPNSPMYELIYMFVWHICPYWHTRAALKSGNSRVINQMWRYWLHLFIATGKTNYALMTMRFLWLMRYLDDSLVDIINDYRIFSFSGDKDTGIPLDGVNELVCNKYTEIRHEILHIPG